MSKKIQCDICEAIINISDNAKLTLEWETTGGKQATKQWDLCPGCKKALEDAMGSLAESKRFRFGSTQYGGIDLNMGMR